MSNLKTIYTNHSINGLIESFNLTIKKSFSINQPKKTRSKVFLSPLPKKQNKSIKHNHINSFLSDSKKKENPLKKLRKNKKILLISTPIKHQPIGLSNLMHFKYKDHELIKCRNIFRKEQSTLSTSIDHHGSNHQTKSDKSQYPIKDINSSSKKKGLSYLISLISYHHKLNSLILFNEDQELNMKDISLNIIEYFETIDKTYNISYNFKCYENFKDKQSPLEIFSNNTINVPYMTLIKIQIILYIIMRLAMIYLSPDEMVNLLKNDLSIVLNQLNHPLNTLYGNFLFGSNTPIEIFDDSLSLQRNIFNELSQYYNKYTKKLNTPKEYLLISINKQTEKCIIELNNYSIFTMKFSKLKPFNKTINSMINIIHSTSDEFISKLALSCVLFSNYTTANKSLKPINKSKLSSPISSNTTISSIDPDINNEDINEEFYLPPINNTYNYTLVVDLDETLVHFFQINSEGTYFVRPYCFDFLEQLYNKYELIIFTASTKDYADRIIDKIDSQHKYFKHRLYRDHITVSNYSIFKDLSRLGRDLSKTIIIDNLEDNFKKQPNNGLVIKTWNGNVDDTELFDMIKILNDLYSLKTQDVREIVKFINKETKRRNINNPYAKISLKDNCINNHNG